MVNLASNNDSLTNDLICVSEMYNVVLDVFCKTSAEGRIPKHSTFQSLTTLEDISASTLFSLAFPNGKDGVDMGFAGSARVSVGFM